MTRPEMYKIFAAITLYYPNATWAATANEAMINAWYEPLAPYPFVVVQAAVKACAFTNPYLPTLSEILEYCKKACRVQLGRTAEEAWAIVDKALRNSAYHSEEEFAKLPRDIQRRVGSAAILKAWALADDNGATYSVARATFIRNYNEDLKEKEDAIKLPESVRQVLYAPESKLLTDF